MKKRTLNFFDRLDSGTMSLFLDRDGVINQRIPGDYVKRWEEFRFIDGVPEAIASLKASFRYVIVVTNQQGIGKGVMTEEALFSLHRQMIASVEEKGGRIDRIYHCPDLEQSGSLYRKPNIGMALRARKDFPGLRLKDAVMVGDSISDLRFGRKAGMFTVFISHDIRQIHACHTLTDFSFPDLPSFASFIKQR